MSTPTTPPDGGAPGAAEDLVPEAASDRSPAAPRQGRRSRGRLLLALAVGLVLLAGAGIVGQQLREQRELTAARADALQKAIDAAPAVLGYDHSRLDQDFAAARGHLTLAFAAEYDELSEKTIRPTATTYKAVVTAQVLASSVEEAGRRSVQVLLFVNQTTSTTELPAPRIDQSRVRMRVVRTDGGWRIAAIEPL
ncbi:MAG: hypothetical protein Q8R60_15145 [Mycobacteriales bacterium]|nr:hypothetical protein [Mycobacteriales bacterium]